MSTFPLAILGLFGFIALVQGLDTPCLKHCDNNIYLPAIQSHSQKGKCQGLQRYVGCVRNCGRQASMNIQPSPNVITLLQRSCASGTGGMSGGYPGSTGSRYPSGSGYPSGGVYSGSTGGGYPGSTGDEYSGSLGGGYQSGGSGYPNSHGGGYSSSYGSHGTYGGSHGGHGHGSYGSGGHFGSKK